jgi:vacuolar-type H+-ATPase subunit H
MRHLAYGLGSCALLLSIAGQPATANPLGDAKNAMQNATNSAPAPPTQAQIDQAKNQIENDLQQAYTQLQQRVNGIVNQQRQQLEQARQAIIAQERATVAQLRSRRPSTLPGTNLPTPSQTAGSPASNMIGGLSTAGQTTNRMHTNSVSTQEPLRLDTTTVDGGGPEVSVAVLGAGFTPGCEVHFRVSASRDVMVRPDWSDSGAIGVTLPADLTGLAPYNGVVYVRRDDGQVSASKPFAFRPRMDVAAVDGELLNSGSHPSQAASLGNKTSGWRFAHLGLALPPVSGTDQIGAGCHLKNGWVVDHVEMNVKWGSASTANLHQGSDDLSFQLQWTASNFAGFYQAACGTFKVIARGPAGLPYK